MHSAQHVLSGAVGSPEKVIWHEVECGGYAVDLPLWRDLAAEAGGERAGRSVPVTTVLELGSGTGRVALDLAGQGYEVVGVERDRELAAELERRVADAGLAVEAVVEDVASLDLARSFDFVLAPMQMIQMLPASARPAALNAIRTHLAPGGLVALAIVEQKALVGPGAADPLPDIRELDGWVYSSRPLWVGSDADELVVKRLRERVSPSGEVERSVHEERVALLSVGELEAEAGAAGLEPIGRRSIANGPSEADSTVILLEGHSQDPELRDRRL